MAPEETTPSTFLILDTEDGITFRRIGEQTDVRGADEALKKFYGPDPSAGPEGKFVATSEKNFKVRTRKLVAKATVEDFPLPSLAAVPDAE